MVDVLRLNELRAVSAMAEALAAIMLPPGMSISVEVRDTTSALVGTIDEVGSLVLSHDEED